MKKLLASLLILTAFLFAAPARAEKAVFTAQTTDSTSDWIPAGQCDKVFVHVWSTTGSGTVTVTIETKTGSESTSNAYTAVSIADPTTAGEHWVGPGVDFFRIKISSSSGSSISVTATGWRGSTQVF